MPALACGSVMIIKASETNPLSALFLVSLSTQARAPSGVINCLIGGTEAGQTLASHMRVRKLSFTGSVDVKRRVQTASAQRNLKSATLELGGKTPVIMFQDTYIERL